MARRSEQQSGLVPSRPQSSKSVSKLTIATQYSSLSVSHLDLKPSLGSPLYRSGRASQPSSPSQILKQALRSGVNSPKAMDSTEQENRPPTAFVFSTPVSNKNASSCGKPPTTPKTNRTLVQSSSVANLSPRAATRVEHQRTSSSKDTNRPDLSKLITQVKQSMTPSSQYQSRGEAIYREHLFNTFQAIKFIRTLKPADPSQLASKTVYVPKTCPHKKTIVFDLDETLVHCVEDVNKAHIAVPITFPSGDTIVAGVNIRPFARECLATVSTFCEVIVFTASQKCYADQVLNYLDPTGMAISHRLYRDSCVVTDGVYIKDLRILGNRRLQDIVIVDNAAYSFGYQLDNGIPIIGWYEDPSDRELFNLVDYLRGLTAADDIRVINRQTFHLQNFYEDYIRDYLR